MFISGKIKKLRNTKKSLFKGLIRIKYAFCNVLIILCICIQIHDLIINIYYFIIMIDIIKIIRYFEKIIFVLFIFNKFKYTLDILYQFLSRFQYVMHYPRDCLIM